MWLSWTRNITVFIYTKLCKNNAVHSKGIWFGPLFCCWQSNVSAFPNPGQTFKALSSTLSHQSSSLGLTNNSSSRIGQGPGRRPRGRPSYFYIRSPLYFQTHMWVYSWRYGKISGLLLDEDSHHNTSVSMFGHHGKAGGHPGSADFSYNTSSSSSPVNSRGAQTF